MERVDLLIANGNVVFREGTRPANLAISGGKVVAILQPGFEIDASRVIDATGKHVLPGSLIPKAIRATPSRWTSISKPNHRPRPLEA